MSGKLETLFRLDNKIIVVTGAVGFLGRKHCEAIAAYGGIPVLLDISEERISAFAEYLNTRYGVAAGRAVVDITDERQVQDNAKQLMDQFGRIDALVNNAANNPKVEKSDGGEFSRLEQFPLEQWSQDIAVGLTGSYLCAKHYGMQIARNSNGGSIVNISSDLALMAPDQRLYKNGDLPRDQQPVKPVTYSVVKTGLIGLTRYLATYWVEEGVRCNAICPGGIENGQPVDFLKEVAARIPLGRLARVDEYQGTLLWMLSEASSYLNGAVVAVDGGRTAW